MSPTVEGGDDVALASLPAVVKVAAAAALLAGVFGAIHVLQIYGVLARVEGVVGPFLIAMGVESLGVCGAALFLYRARRWAPGLGAAVGALLWVTSAAWFLFAAFNGFVTLFGFVVPIFGFAAFVLALVARKACLATAQARERLAAQGLELGL